MYCSGRRSVDAAAVVAVPHDAAAVDGAVFRRGTGGDTINSLRLICSYWSESFICRYRLFSAADQIGFNKGRIVGHPGTDWSSG